MRMKYLWNHTKKLAEKCGIDELRLFVTINTVGWACLFLLAYIIVTSIIGIHVEGVIGSGSLCTLLAGIVIGLFGSVLWMIRHEEEMG